MSAETEAGPSISSYWYDAGDPDYAGISWGKGRGNGWGKGREDDHGWGWLGSVDDWDDNSWRYRRSAMERPWPPTDDMDLSPIILCRECLSSFPYPQEDTGSRNPLIVSQLRSRHLPTPSEGARVQMYIDDLANDLSRYSRESRRLESMIEKLTLQRRHLETYRSDYVALLSPVRRLPPELLGQILEYCCQFPPPNKPRDRRRAVLPEALVLSHVCCYWREVAQSLPSLWSSLRVYLWPTQYARRAMGSDSDLSPSESYAQTQFTQYALSLSRSAPLSILLEAPGTVDPEGNKHLAIDELFQNSHRWQTVVWRLQNSGPHSPPALPPAGSASPGRFPLPLLRSLSLHGGTLRDHLQIFGSGGSNLKHLSLQNLSFEPQRSGTSFPWRNVTSAVVCKQTVPEILDVLRSCPNLCTLTLTRFRYYTDWETFINPESSAPVFQLDHLTSLTVSTDRLHTLLVAITTPALASLHMSSALGNDGAYHDVFPQDTFLEFLSRCSVGGSFLKELTLDKVKLTDTQLLEILHFTPNLETLKVNDYHGPKESYDDQWAPPPESPLPYSAVPGHARHSAIPLTITNHLLRSLTIQDDFLFTSRPWSPSVAGVNLLPRLHTIDFVTNLSRVDYGPIADVVSSRSRQMRTGTMISSLGSVSIRQGGEYHERTRSWGGGSDFDVSDDDLCWNLMITIILLSYYAYGNQSGTADIRSNDHTDILRLFILLYYFD
ncbi:hypothetical protein D9758_017191 [Tetrapyrgos nigripes]|uniref:F-box domain-containing protein n=1 Tax=Tetrapyrgos nigripes TaxID=182062 RepID=A0A8H5FCP9_9AGAR|nr:hypothetical protein D9758_017191 [Tetrapyrgos nigripes]